MNKDKLSMARTDREGLSEEIRHGEVNNRLRHDVSEEKADQRHDVSEEKADQRHSENSDLHGSTRRILYGVVGSLIAVIAMGVVYHYFAMYKALKKNVSLRQENAVLRNAANEDKEDDIKLVKDAKLKLQAAGEKIQGLQAKVNFQAGRLNDMGFSIANQSSFIKELKARIYDVKYLPYPAQQVMYYSAYHTVAENLRPKDLSQWIGKATPEEWIGYLRMAVARNSFNVYEAIMEHEEVTAIPEVADYISTESVLAKLKR